jgi:hypothetical protein
LLFSDRFCTDLAWTHFPFTYGLLDSWNYRHEPSCLAIIWPLLRFSASPQAQSNGTNDHGLNKYLG